MSAPQTISASYIEQLIEANEQALASIKLRMRQCDIESPIENMKEWEQAMLNDYRLESAITQLKHYHAFLVAKENAEHRAERLTKSTIGL